MKRGLYSIVNFVVVVFTSPSPPNYTPPAKSTTGAEYRYIYALTKGTSFEYVQRKKDKVLGQTFFESNASKCLAI